MDFWFLRFYYKAQYFRVLSILQAGVRYVNNNVAGYVNGKWYLLHDIFPSYSGIFKGCAKIC